MDNKTNPKYSVSAFLIDPCYVSPICININSFHSQGACLHKEDVCQVDSSINAVKAGSVSKYFELFMCNSISCTSVQYNSQVFHISYCVQTLLAVKRLTG